MTRRGGQGPNWLIGGLALLALVLAGAAPGPAPAGPGRPIRDEPRLSLNQTMDYRQRVSADQAQGEAQIRELVATAAFEELWAFLPAQDQWLEIGCCERLTAAGSYVGVEAYVLDLMARHAEMAIYHVHPHTRFQKENYTAAKRRQKVLEEALPSLPDMEAMLSLTQAQRRLRPDGRLAWRIVSRHGVTEYGLARPDDPLPEDPDLRPFAFSRLGLEELEDAPEDLEANRALIGRACADLSRPPFRVTFRPW
ncbi:MAG: hypothetical protein LDL11_03705 [Desulfarculus sp.]|nr:hypothetical protein [Desulfarculus sp.]